jgi:hypothetical protein
MCGWLLVDEVEFSNRWLARREGDRDGNGVGASGQCSNAIARDTDRGELTFKTETSFAFGRGGVNTLPEDFLLPVGISAFDEGCIAPNFRDGDRDCMRNGGQQKRQAAHSRDEYQHL